MPALTNLRRAAILAPSKGGGVVSLLRRESDGTVTVLALRRPYTAAMTRQPDGSVVVSG